MLRTTFCTGKVLLTQGVAALPEESRARIIAAVRSFSDFTPDNDPYGEHDFGAIDLPGIGRISWKIDYYDLSYTWGSEDPSDPAQTRRVLTILFPEEY